MASDLEKAIAQLRERAETAEHALTIHRHALKGALAKLAALRDALFAPIVRAPQMGALAVLADAVADSHDGVDPGGCELCLAMQKVRELLEADNG